MLAGAQNYLGIKSGIVDYNLKSQYGRQVNRSMYYSVISEFKYNEGISFGIEGGGYGFSFDNNKSTNLFIKPSVIFGLHFNKRNSVLLSGGFSYDVSVKSDIKTKYQNYPTKNDTSFVSEKAFFYKSFAAPFVSISYCRNIGNIGLGINVEYSASQGGFYKGYESNFTRVGLFIKRKF